MHVGRAADAGDEPGDEITLQLHPGGVDGEGAGVVLVVADRDEQLPEPSAPNIARQQDGQHQHGKGEVVVAVAAVQGVAEQNGSTGIDTAAEDPRLLQQPIGYGEREGQRGHGQQQSTAAQRGQPSSTDTTPAPSPAQTNDRMKLPVWLET